MQQVAFKILNKIYRTNLKNNIHHNGRSMGIQRYNEYYTPRYATDDPWTKTFIRGRSGINNCDIRIYISDWSVGERNRLEKGNQQFSIEHGPQVLPLEPSDFTFDATSYW